MMITQRNAVLRFTGRRACSEDYPPLSRRRRPNAWPACDRQAWERAYKVEGPLSPRGPAAHLSPDTRKIRELAYGRLLSFLDSVGELHPERPTETRLTDVLLSAYIRSMRGGGLRAHTIRALLYNLSLTLAAMVPSVDWSWVRRNHEAPTTAAVRASKKPVHSPNPFKLLRRAFQHCDQADAASTVLRAALDYRDGLLIGLLIIHAIRLKNLSEIQLGDHLQVYRSHTRLAFDKTVKNREVVDVVLCRNLDQRVRHYLAVHRPVLLRNNDDHCAMWVNIDGAPLRYGTIANRITKVAKRWGYKLSAHSARYALATTIMTLDPRRIGVASAALAHRGVSSVNQVYDKSGSLVAQAYWLQMLDDRRSHHSKAKRRDQ